MKNDFIVPVTPAIQEFYDHLLCHPRTILSARYGDGKSYFLDSFRNDKAVKRKFKFITVYPVNYQVLENQDVFDVIKYDILLQMGLNDMLDETVEISNGEAFLYLLKTKGLDLIENLFDVAGCIEGAPKVKAVSKIGATLTKVVKKIQDTVKEYREYKKGDLGVLDKYVDKIDESPIYEEDLVTKIIQNNIAAWRKKRGNGKKRVVLLFEDMDRIDPAHLFRILNIFSAHMDFSYRYGVKPDISLRGNKFGVDNVVMVIHYENLKNIFHHFYGKDTCFEGYIHKFADKGKFDYSLKSDSIKYYYDCLNKLSLISEDYLRLILTEDKLRQYTLREMRNSLDNVGEQRKNISGAQHDLSIVMTCMRRLGFNDDAIVGCVRDVVEQDFPLWIRFLHPYLQYFGKLEKNDIQLVDDEGNKHSFTFHSDSTGVKVYATNYTSSSVFHKLDDIIRDILSLVIR